MREMAKNTVLLADDEDTLRDNLAQVLREEGFDVVVCRDGAAALRALNSTTVDAIVTDLRMPGLSGMELIDCAREIAPEASIIVMTAFGQVETAVEAMKKGAKDYLCKPLILEELVFKLKQLIAHGAMARENRFLREQLRQRHGASGIIGHSRASGDIRKTIQRVSQTMSNVLICGDSGTGKEVLARALHYEGITKDKPFVAVNCGGLVENLVESELFGYRRGAFTGAVSDHTGYFEAADSGTLFLDEISNLPLVSQAVLLRAIEEKAVTRVGDNRPRPVNIRIIAATNKDLKQALLDGEFREDLFYRLNVVEIRLPSLHERPDDIPPLVDHFVQKYNAELNCNCPGFDGEAMQALYLHSWPGNIRELENVVERALIFADDQPVGVQDLSIPAGGSSHAELSTTNLREAVHQYEKGHITKVLLSCGNNRASTAEKLGIGLSSLYRKMEELGIAKHPADPAHAS